MNQDKIILQYHYLQFYKHYSVIFPTFKILLLITFNLITYFTFEITFIFNP